VRCRPIVVVLGALVVVGACATSSPPSAVELQAELAAHNIDFEPTGLVLDPEDRPDLVARTQRSSLSARAPDGIYEGTLHYLISPGSGYDHAVWAVHYSDTKQHTSGPYPYGGTDVIADVAVFVDRATETVIFTIMYTVGAVASPLTHPFWYGVAPPPGSTEVDAAALTTDALVDAAALIPGDRLFVVPTAGDHAVFVRMRRGAAPLLFGTSCDVVSAARLPAGWQGICLEYTAAGERIVGVFPHGTVSAPG
jgi:hypothetical protein